MVGQPIYMLNQLCIIEDACYEVFEQLYLTASDEVQNSPRNSTMSNAFVEYGLFTEDMTFAAYCWIAGVGGALLNIMTILVLSLGTKNSLEMRVQLINLAICDCLMSMVEPQVFYHHRFTIPVDQTMCKFAGFAQYATFTLSTLCNMAISIDRFVAVYYPLQIHHYTTCHKVGTAVAIWLIAFAVDIGAIFNCNIWQIRDFEWCFCTPTRYTKQLGTTKDNIIRFSKYGIPAFVIIFLYILIGIRMTHWKKVGDNCTLSAIVLRQDKRMKRQVRLVAVINICCKSYS